MGDKDGDDLTRAPSLTKSSVGYVRYEDRPSLPVLPSNTKNYSNNSCFSATEMTRFSKTEMTRFSKTESSSRPVHYSKTESNAPRTVKVVSLTNDTCNFLGVPNKKRNVVPSEALYMDFGSEELRQQTSSTARYSAVMRVYS